ncbi:MAG TPA: SpoIIE family protein phosphatase [Acidimicrobiales bacterium]|nr:SpoIIE family protein phosphatase [Acidimicrobiales bacterium]
MGARGSPLGDPARLAALSRTGLLDSEPSEGFDRLTRLATKVLHAPVSLVSLVDDRRQFFKSAIGLPVRETPLTHSFCQHVVRSGEAFVVADARADDRVTGNLAIDELGVVAYAGVPIVAADGEILGSFCVIDSSPREWTADDLDLLEELAGSVVTEVELAAALREAHLAQGRLALLAEASTLLATLDSTATLQSLARLAVRSLCDWCSIAVVGPDGTSVDRVAIAHVDPHKEVRAQSLREKHRHDPDAKSGVPWVIRTGEPRLVPVVDEAAMRRASLGDGYGELLLELGFASAMVVPLSARGRALGAITFASGPTRVYGEADLQVATDLARRAGLALDNARAYETQREIAGTLQRSLLPPKLPDIGAFSVAATYKTPGDSVLVGGDFYDLFPLRGPGWGVAIGDVQGKGSEAATLTALARYTVRAGALTLRNPKQVLRTLNEAVLRESSDRFLTVALLTLQPARDGLRARLCLAGHPRPFVVRAESGEVEQVGRAGTLLGVIEAVDLTVVTFDLRPGDVIVLFTDGLIEARRDHEQFGDHGVREVLASSVGDPPGQVVRALEEAVTAYGRGEPRDDLAIVALGRPADG